MIMSNNKKVSIDENSLIALRKRKDCVLNIIFLTIYALIIFLINIEALLLSLMHIEFIENEH